MDGLITPEDRTPSSSVVLWQPVPDSRLRLICLPHAGGGAALYRAWAEWLAPEIETVAIRLPGRESRLRERPFTSMDDMAPVLFQELTPLLDSPYVLFGHSLGALIAFELCRLVRRAGLPGPQCLVVSGRPAPHLPPRFPLVHDAPAPRLIARIREMGGTPPEILNDLAVLASMMPYIRADFAVAETYRHKEDAALENSIIAYCGAGDRYATTNELREWQHHTNANFLLRTFEGGHFFLHEHPRQLLKALSADIGSAPIAHQR